MELCSWKNLTTYMHCAIVDLDEILHENDQ